MKTCGKYSIECWRLGHVGCEDFLVERFRGYELSMPPARLWEWLGYRREGKRQEVRYRLYRGMKRESPLADGENGGAVEGTASRSP